MRYTFVLLFAVAAWLPAAPAHALDKVDPYICPTKTPGTGIECFLEAIPQTYTMCRHIKSIEIIEFGLDGAQEGVNGAKTESCIEKHKLSITRPYQAALREAARNKDEVVGLRKLYDTWLDSLAKLTPVSRRERRGLQGSRHRIPTANSTSRSRTSSRSPTALAVAGGQAVGCTCSEKEAQGTVAAVRRDDRCPPQHRTMTSSGTRQARAIRVCAATA